LWAQTTYSRNSPNGEWNYFIDAEGTAQNIDWNRWLGSAPKRAFSAERYFRWRKYWDYSGGIATDLFYHRLGPVLFAMGSQLPLRVGASGGIYVQKDREVPDTYATTIEYANFYVTMSSSMANSAANKYFAETIYGHQGTITFGPGNVVITPEGRGEPKVHTVAPQDIAVDHRNNFFECMRTRKIPVLNPELGFQLMTAIRLGVDSYRQGRLLAYDARTNKVTDKFAGRPAYEGKGENFQGARGR
jgi:predicted dehydrogenase